LEFVNLSSNISIVKTKQGSSIFIKRLIYLFKNIAQGRVGEQKSTLGNALGHDLLAVLKIKSTNQKLNPKPENNELAVTRAQWRSYRKASVSKAYGPSSNGGPARDLKICN
jgi:hypothetical protein